MNQILVSVQDAEKARMLVQLLQSLDFVVQVETTVSQLTLAIIEPIKQGEEISADEPADFFSLFGIWKDRDISLEQIRETAWPKRV